MRYQIASGHSIDDVLCAISRGRVVYALEPSDAGQYHLVRAETWQPGTSTLGSFRPVEPLKSLVFRPREFLGQVGGNGEQPAMPERIMIGVKNCDLSALRIHDHVMLKTEPADPLYAEAREKTILVSCDCTDCLEVCFCPVVGEQPHAKEGFDINVSPTPKGYVIETGSERGARVLEAARDLLQPAGDALVQERDKSRAAMYQRVVDQAAAKGLRPGMDFKKAISKSFESKLWEDFAEDCVECGACNFCCCTCHCFLLADGRGASGAPERVKLWDSCLFKNFARVAGGANMRPHRAERLLNRFDKKFNFFPDVLKTYACDGCGRCVEACTGKIDIRDVLKRAVDEA
ncbi:MAG: 4Fe-4S dicluster domain-containing protein [Verrucomicrobia bacterium]|nr:4Fe-4S dicluster domain-containing protein [Verrucomicrobiota bacterium]MBU1909022.1 4Fe-4S dicluster domain-containing protein [Verrucomicrobiota bacterium]